MFEPFAKGNGEDARPTPRDNRTYQAGRYKSHAGPSRSSFLAPPTKRTPGSPLAVPRSATRPVGPTSSPSRPGRPRRVSAANVLDAPVERGWWVIIMRPTKEQADRWLSSFWKRWTALVILPCLVIWTWVAVPFPIADPYSSDEKFHWEWRWPWSPSELVASGGLAPLSLSNGTTPANPSGENSELPVDLNFFFFLFFYMGLYLQFALLFITKAFDLYRLNWWPKRIGGAASYLFFWTVALGVGWVVHDLDLVGSGKTDKDRGADWERKTFWIGLTFATMACPALVCFSVLKREKRHVYRHSLSELQKALLERQLSRRIPASYLRFLWFISALATALFALIAGQAYTSMYFSTLPHTSLDAGIWVWSWVGTTTCLGMIASHILESKVRSQGLLFLFKYFSSLVYMVFYRTLFARLRSPQDFILVQSLSTIGVCIVFPFQMTSIFHRGMTFFLGYKKTLEEHRENVAITFHVRSIAQNVSMVAFLGWLPILHFGPNQSVYPFFRFASSEEDPYTFRLTFWASSIIWASELTSSLVTRTLCRAVFSVDIARLGWDIMRDYPELIPACGWASVHVLANILLYLCKLNFR